MTEDDFKRIEHMMTHQMARQFGMMEEHIQHKLDLLVEDQQMLGERMDRIETRMDRLEVRVTSVEGKVTAIAADLAAHRADTEAHHGVYQVRET